MGHYGLNLGLTVSLLQCTITSHRTAVLNTESILHHHIQSILHHHIQSILLLRHIQSILLLLHHIQSILHRRIQSALLLYIRQLFANTMASESTHFRAFLVSYLGIGDDHHAIFIQTVNGKVKPKGSLFHVIGNLHEGMDLDIRHGNCPFESPSLLSMKQVGWVSHDMFADAEGVIRTVLPPAKQFHLSQRLVPKDKVRHCQHWAAEAKDALREKGILTLLAPGESGTKCERVATSKEPVWADFVFEVVGDVEGSASSSE